MPEDVEFIDIPVWEYIPETDACFGYLKDTGRVKRLTIRPAK